MKRTVEGIFFTLVLFVCSCVGPFISWDTSNVNVRILQYPSIGDRCSARKGYFFILVLFLCSCVGEFFSGGHQLTSTLGMSTCSYKCSGDVADIGGILVHSVLKSNQIAQHVIADGAKPTRQNGTARTAKS